MALKVTSQRVNGEFMRKSAVGDMKCKLECARTTPCRFGMYLWSKLSVKVAMGATKNTPTA